MGKKSKPMKPWLQIALGSGLIIWGAGSLIYQMKPDVIGLKSVPILLLIAGIANLYIGIKRNNNPEKDATAETQEDANNKALSITTKADALNIDDDTKQSSIYQFLLNSYQSWKDGVFDSLSDYYKKTATKDSPEVLTGVMLKESSFKPFLEQCFKARAPQHSEFMYTISPDNFMITNKCLYINTKIKQGEMHVAPLCDIVAYSNKGLWMKTGTLKLKSGKEIHVKLDAVPDENSLRQLQQLLNCNQLIDV